MRAAEVKKCAHFFLFWGGLPSAADGCSCAVSGGAANPSKTIRLDG